MANFRCVVNHVRYWRGGIHRWSTSYLMTGSLSTPIDTAACQTLLLADNKMLYVDTAGTKAGGAYHCAIYNAGGGSPLASYTLFDWQTPSTWINPVGSVWTATTNVVDSTAENALLVEWPAGLSRTGKPVKFRKWYHQVPITVATLGAPQVSSAAQTALAAQANNVSICLFSTYGIALGGSGRLPGSPVVSAYYANHQMPRGRRKRVSSSVKQQSSDFSSILQLLESKGYQVANSP